MTRAPHMAARNWVQSAISSDTDECMIWPYAKLNNGYGQFHTGVKVERVHRHVCSAVHGPAPSAIHEAAHRCGNRACGNPKHVRWATPVQNHADQIEHGTINRGARHGQVKLTEGDVLDLRRSPQNYSELARRFGVSPATIRDAKLRKTWAWLSDTNSPSA